MAYRASSVVRALRGNQTISTKGLDLVVCPLDSCTSEPEECSMGQNQTCEKEISIIYDDPNGRNALATLIFRYQSREIEREGFIKKDDYALKKLIRRGIIKEKTLVAV